MMWNWHPNDVMALMSILKRTRIHKCRSVILTMLRSENARAHRRKLVDDLRNIGFWIGCVRFWFETAKTFLLNVASKCTEFVHLFIVGWH